MPARFTDRTKLDGSATLTDVQQMQLDAIGPLYFGGTGAARLACDDSDDDPMERRTLMGCEVWRVKDGPKHLFDAWFYMGDSGTIFTAGTANRVAEIVQCGLQCSDRKVRANIGAAMVEAKLLPESDSAYKEFATLVEPSKRPRKKAKQRPGKKGRVNGS